MNTIDFFNVRMRAHKTTAQVHVSGAERIVKQPDITRTSHALVQRALDHDNGPVDAIHLTVERLATAPRQLAALPVLQADTTTPEHADAYLKQRLQALGIADAAAVIEQLRSIRRMRGARLIDSSGADRTPHPTRGVRVSALDNTLSFHSDPGLQQPAKAHFAEALTLATKVCSHPAVLAELCISDDPAYTTGYLATAAGYERIPHIKQPGSSEGGRIIVLRADADITELVAFLETTPVLVNVDQATPPTPAPPPADCHPAPPSLEEYCQDRLEALTAAHLLRNPQTLSTAQLPRAVLAGQEQLLLSSSNYLGLATDPRMIQAEQQATAHYGTGSGGSRLTTGTTQLHEELEAALSTWLGYEDALFFATGYQCNVAIVQALGTADCVIFSDERNHASLIDGCRMSKARRVIFPHRDYAALEELLAATRAMHSGPIILLSDGVFSMDGTVADLAALQDLADKYGAWTVLDDAHGIGTLGTGGRGSIEVFDTRPDILIGTASKALGSAGAFACCSQDVATYLRHQARGYVYSTAPSAGNCAAVRQAIDIIQTDSVVEQLQHNVACLRAALDIPGTSPIIPIPIGQEAAAAALAAQAADAGIHIPAIRYPTVARGQAILRATVMATHTAEQLEQAATFLLAAIAKQQ